MLLGVAVVPSAPLLLPAIAPRLPAELVGVRRLVTDVLAGLPAADVAVLVAAGAPGVHPAARLAFSEVGRRDLDGELAVCRPAVCSLARATGVALREGTLPLELAVLACLATRDTEARDLAGAGRAVAALAVDGTAQGCELAAVGDGVVEALSAEALGAVLVAAGDGSAGLSDHAPRQVPAGAREWEERFANALPRPERLAELGPGQAAGMAARGWAPALVASVAARTAGLSLRLHLHTAPRGVGYVVASSA